jgi:N6-adenosine-specific RNA methylase IME4
MKFKTIMMDPPWNETGGGKIRRGADKHYDLIKPQDMLSAVVQGINSQGTMDENSHCYIWVTNNFLQDGLDLMQQLGYRYITNIVWVKDRFGLGQYFRGQHELMIFGVRGKFHRNKIPDRNCSTVIQAKRRAHSQKPDQQYDLIEQISAGPYLELFARTNRPGWNTWGDEIESSPGQTTFPLL